MENIYFVPGISVMRFLICELYVRAVSENVMRFQNMHSLNSTQKIYGLREAWVLRRYYQFV